MARNHEALWSFLLFSGYLTATEVRSEAGELMARLRVPNEEVLGELSTMVKAWLREQVGGSAEVDRMLEAPSVATPEPWSATSRGSCSRVSRTTTPAALARSASSMPSSSGSS